MMQRLLLTLTLLASASAANANTSLNPSPYEGCGTLIQSGSCVLYQADNGNTYNLNEGTAGFPVGAFLHIIGTQSPCASDCSSNACIFDVTTIESCSSDPTTGFCENTDISFPCPCGNLADLGAGCQNSTGLGARMTGSGTASVSADDLVLESTQLPPGRPALLFSGDVNQQPGMAFGDGVRCAGGSLRRFDVRIPNGQGIADWGPGLATQAGWQVGQTAYTQVWYRDSVAGPCSSGFNISAGRSVTLAP